MPPTDKDLIPLVPQWLGVPADSKVEVEELPYFFRNHTKEDSEDEETARRFREL
jgi:hypothetical protein